MTLLGRDDILTAFTRLDAELARRGVRAELFLVGGAVMCLVHQARPSTKDVDGWFTEPQVVREAAGVVARDLSLATDWLNDAAKAFVPDNAGFDVWRAMPNLTIAAADASTMLAMKAAAARTDADLDDIKVLAGVLGLTTSLAILEVVGRYFADDRLPVRTRLLLEEIFDDGD